MTTLPSIFFENDVPMFIAFLVIYYMFRGMHWHAMYAFYMPALVFAIYVSHDSNPMIAGVVIGVLSNQIFNYLNGKLQREANNSNQEE